MKYGRYGIKEEAKARPEAPRNERATGKMQQPTGRSEKNAENIETPLATAVREAFIGLHLVSNFYLQSFRSPNYFAKAAFTRGVANITRAQTFTNKM